MPGGGGNRSRTRGRAGFARECFGRRCVELSCCQFVPPDPDAPEPKSRMGGATRNPPFFRVRCWGSFACIVICLSWQLRQPSHWLTRKVLHPSFVNTITDTYAAKLYRARVAEDRPLIPIKKCIESAGNQRSSVTSDARTGCITVIAEKINQVRRHRPTSSPLQDTWQASVSVL